MSKLISKEEMNVFIQNGINQPAIEGYTTDREGLAKAQHDASDKEWIEWIERQAWHYESETSNPDGYYIPFEIVEILKQKVEKERDKEMETH